MLKASCLIVLRLILERLLYVLIAFMAAPKKLGVPLMLFQSFLNINWAPARPVPYSHTLYIVTGKQIGRASCRERV